MPHMQRDSKSAGMSESTGKKGKILSYYYIQNCVVFESILFVQLYFYFFTLSKRLWVANRCMGENTAPVSVSCPIVPAQLYCISEFFCVCGQSNKS